MNSGERFVEKPCLALICNPFGLVINVIRDDLEIMKHHPEHPPFSTLSAPDNTDKALRFLKELEEHGAVTGWEMVLQVGDRLQTFHFSGGSVADNWLVVGSTAASGLEAQFEEMMRICSLQANQIRQQIKQQSISDHQRSQNEDFIDDLSRLNNELVSTQRELAKKNLELESLYEAEQRRSQELNALYQATFSLLSTLDLDQLLERILKAAFQALPQADRGLLLLKNPSQENTFQIRASRGWERAPDPQSLQAALAGPLARAHQEREPLVIDPPEWIDLEDMTREMVGEGSGLIIPLLLEKEIGGYLVLHTPQTQALEDADLNLWQAFGATTAAAIQNALLHEQIQKMAVTDPLTGVHNRRGFRLLAEQQVKGANRYSQPLAVMMIDLDHFKEINDQYGHQVGDQVLQGVTQRLEGELREADLLGRYGGEEFIILLPNTGHEGGLQIAHRLLNTIRQSPLQTTAGPIEMTISIGLSSGREDLALDEMIQSADRSLYRAKESGRDQVHAAS